MGRVGVRGHHHVATHYSHLYKLVAGLVFRYIVPNFWKHGELSLVRQSFLLALHVGGLRNGPHYRAATSTYID